MVQGPLAPPIHTVDMNTPNNDDQNTPNNNDTSTPNNNAAYDTSGIRSKKGKQAIRWLFDMALFYEELQLFIRDLSPNTDASQLVQIPAQVKDDPRFQNLCRVSTECKYVSDIPIKYCRQAVEIVHDLARDTFKTVLSHPTFSTFSGPFHYPPFFEKAMVIGTSLAVEHDIDFDNAIREQRMINNKAKRISDRFKKFKRTNTRNDDETEVEHICEVFGI